MAFTQVDLRSLVNALNIPTNKDDYAEVCFKCGAKKKLHFSYERQDWHCFVCNSKGGVLSLYSQYVLGMDLPEDKQKRSEISRELQQFMGCDNPATSRVSMVAVPTRPKRYPASDEQCHSVYSALASLAIFQLDSKHQADLMKRGFSEQLIRENEYRTFPYKVDNIPANIVSLYTSVDPSLRADHNEKQAHRIQMGLYVAHLLQEKGHNLDGIPGFYKFGDFWCLHYVPGLMIPTRNISGQIIRWQVRNPYGKPKYRTLSCSDRPDAVTEGIARSHFPKKNAPLSSEHRLIFTEGPLKADVALALSKDPCTYVAIPGVGMYELLMRECDAFKQAGVTVIYNALDMDRLTNPNVRLGSDKINEEFAKRGITVIPMYWAERYAVRTLMAYKAVALARGVQIPAFDFRAPVYEDLNIVADALNRAGIDPGKVSDGFDYWDPNTKGIDDYLYSRLHLKEKQNTLQRQEKENK